MHDSFQIFLDNILSLNETIETKIKILDTHLRAYFEDYLEMTLLEASNVSLADDQYFYITFTYLDAPIDLSKADEVVVSMIYDTVRFYIEISIFDNHHHEYTYQITEAQFN